MSQYYNPIHPSIATQSHTQYTSLGGAMQGASLAQSTFLAPNRRRVPQSIYQPNNQRRLQAGRAVTFQPSVSIDFKGYSRQGIKMIELYARGTEALSRMMEGAGDRVLAHAGSNSIMLHIRWPGYEKIEWIRPISLQLSSGPITRAELAAAVSSNFHRYFEKLQFTPPSFIDWHIGPAGITFDRLVLVSIVNVFEGVWQAEVAVDT
ncbi:hypothetical protein GYMLUDRAFT_151896 [Collybiopsis luxurians FD-317 M1]|nr:hypothetical protein GYMLUDRAFT_151896 [Collybiopsis luxurians FD-317 M1]